MYFVGLDTALQNMAVVILDESNKAVFSGKPFPKKEEHAEWGPERINSVFKYIKKGMEDLLLKEVVKESSGKDVWRWTAPNGKRFFLGIEDYILSGHQKAYETAELVGVLRNWCIEEKISYSMNHPQKVLKYVKKAKDVSKTEIINFVKEVCPGVFFNIEKADYSDVADAYVNAKIGQMVYEVSHRIDTVLKKEGKSGYVKEYLLGVVRTMPYQERWIEILIGPSSPWDTGSMTKPGLYRYYPQT